MATAPASLRCFPEGVMQLQPLHVDLLDILNRQDRPVVRVLRVFPAIQLVSVYFSQNLGELLLGVVDVPEHLIVEMQNTGPWPSAVRRSSMVMWSSSFLMTSALTARPMALGQPRPGVNLDGGNLHKGHQNQKQTAPAS